MDAMCTTKQRMCIHTVHCVYSAVHCVYSAVHCVYSVGQCGLREWSMDAVSLLTLQREKLADFLLEGVLTSLNWNLQRG
jgi:hypothetical protein